jgi:tryptophan-rich sensory protein
MDSARLWVGITSVLLVAVYIIGSVRWVDSGDPWYRSLVRPPWQPPSGVPGIVWIYNYIVLFIAAVQVARHGSGWELAVWTVCLVVSVVASLMWSWLFFGQHALWVSSAALIVAAVFTAPLVIAAWGAQGWVGALLVPYLLWMCIAASVAVGYAQRNADVSLLGGNTSR